MKIFNGKKLLTLIGRDKKIDHTQNKIELISCRFNGKNCKKYLAQINQSFNQSDNYFKNKDYPLSIQVLKDAFHVTYEMHNSTCKACAKQFRSTIINSLENIHAELHQLSSGHFRPNYYRGSYLMAQNVLEDFKKNT